MYRFVFDMPHPRFPFSTCIHVFALKIRDLYSVCTSMDGTPSCKHLCSYMIFSLSNLQPFSTGSHCMRLNSRTLENLEIFKNQVSHSHKSSDYISACKSGACICVTWLLVAYLGRHIHLCITTIKFGTWSSHFFVLIIIV